VPRSSADAARDAAQAREDNEASKRERLAGGELGLDMYNMRPRLEEAGLVYLDSLSDWEDLQ
jgi:4-hydroxy-4-methyl-2-oxoglutarate aldolase